MYGLRGNEHNVSVLSPYEMLLHWSMERVHVPNTAGVIKRSTWTEEGEDYVNFREEAGVKAKFIAGKHYIAAAATKKILLPEISQLKGLRHKWCWEKRHRPHVPTWSFAKVPRVTFSREENSRMMSVYMRPWSLNPVDASKCNPLLNVLGLCREDSHTGRRSWDFEAAMNDVFESQRSHTNQKKQKGEIQAVGTRAKADCKYVYSYATSWNAYVQGNVVSQTSKRLVQNMLMATAAVRMEQEDDSSDDSDAEQWAHLHMKVGGYKRVSK